MVFTYLLAYGRDINLSLAIVVGVGEHSHLWPVELPPKSKVNEIAKEEIHSDQNSTTRSIYFG